MTSKDLGLVTAYAYAVSQGYTGTEEEFATLMASYATVAEEAAESAAEAAASATAAGASETNAASSAASAGQSATSAGNSATSASGSAVQAQSSATAAGQSATQAAGSATAAGQSATAAAGSASQAAASETAAGASATAAAGSATSAANSATAAAGSATEADASADRAQEILDSIPEDYSELSEDVANLSSALQASDSGLVLLTIIPGKYVNPSTGAYQTSQTQSAIDYVDCSEFSAVTLYAPEATAYGAWYDSTKTRTASLSLKSGLQTITVPSGAQYFACSLKNASISGLKVYTNVGSAMIKANNAVELNKLTGNDVTITTGKYIGYSTGSMGTSSAYGATGKIPVVGGTQYKVNIYSKSATDSAGLAFYRDDGYISGVQFIKDTAEYIVTAPDNANQIAISVTLANSIYGYFELTALDNLKDLTEYIYKAIGETVPETIPNVFAFQTVGVVGDSLASGCSNYQDDQEVYHALDRKAFAWGKFLEKRQGCSVSLFSSGGMSTRAWFTSENGYAKAVNDPRECYIIGLGVNDFSSASLGQSYLGSISDVHVGSEDQNADTFYGNYSKIIATLTTIQPRCKIFCLTMPGNQGSSQTRLDYDTAIRTVTALYDNAYLLDLSDDPFFTSEPLVSTWYGAHYLATGYSMIADHLLEVMNKFMLNNLSDFADIQWITNNYPNSESE